MALTILTAITVTPSRGAGQDERQLALSMGSIGHLNIALQGDAGVGIRQPVRRRFEPASAANSLRQKVNWFQRRAFACSYSPLQNAEILPSMSLTSSAKWSFR